MHRPALSIVIPCYNEEGCLETLHARVGAAARAAVGGDYEIVLVNDGSRDASCPAMQRLAAGAPKSEEHTPALPSLMRTSYAVLSLNNNSAVRCLRQVDKTR